jgi:hypothetical protein
LLIAADVAALFITNKMDVLKGCSVRSEGNASTTLSRHVLLVLDGYWLKMDNHNLYYR